MKKKELSSFKQFAQVDAGDLLFGKSLSGNEYGFFPASFLGDDGYILYPGLINLSSLLTNAFSCCIFVVRQI